MYLNSSISTIEPVSAAQASTAKPAPVQAAEQKQTTTDNSEKRARVKADKVVEVQSALKQHDISMKFSQNEQTSQIIIQLVNDKTGELIRQLPSEVSLKLASEFIKLQGALVDAQA
jgi:flagellar protein FlaG